MTGRFRGYVMNVTVGGKNDQGRCSGLREPRAVAQLG